MAYPQNGALNGVFDVRFYLNRRDWPANPYGFGGPGQVMISDGFLTTRGSSHRAFRFPKREQHSVRVADILNVRVEAEDVIFDVLHLPENLELGFSAADRETAQRIAALLPTRQTEEFAVAYAEREIFHDRIDYWSPSTPVLWFLLASNILVYLLMWVERQTPAISPLTRFPGWYSPAEAAAHLELLALRGLGVLYQLAHWETWKPLALNFLGFGRGTDSITLLNQAAQWGSNIPQLTLGLHQYWRLVSSMFMHGNLLHICLNMFTLWQVGQLVERIFGSLRFAGLYLLAGLSGSIASVLWMTHKLMLEAASRVPPHLPYYSVGASGAIFGIIGGLLAFISRKNSGVPPTVVQSLRKSILPFLLFNIAAGILYPHTDNAAHIGGLVGGWLAGYVLARSLHLPEQRPA